MPIEMMTTVGHVLKTYMSKITAEYQELHFVYDENMDFESAVKKWRSKNKMHDFTPAKMMPLFIFKRSPLRYHDEHQRRSSRKLPIEYQQVDSAGNPTGTDIEIFRTLYASMDIPFLYVHNNFYELENFEIGFLNEDGLSRHKEFVVDVPNIGSWNFFCRYGEFEDKPVESEGMYYKGLTGTITIHGWYVSAKGTGSVISELNAEIRNWYGSVLSELTID